MSDTYTVRVARTRDVYPWPNRYTASVSVGEREVARGWTFTYWGARRLGRKMALRDAAERIEEET